MNSHKSTMFFLAVLLVGLLIRHHVLIDRKLNAQTTLIKNVSEQLSEIRSEFTLFPNPEGWPGSKDK